MTFSRTGIATLGAAVMLSLTATMAEAKGFSAGHFRFQEGTALNATVCLRANGTFFSTNGGDVTGRWVNRTLNGTATGFLFGNFDGGSGNTSVIALGVANSKLTEWFDANTSLQGALNAVRITKLSNACPVLPPHAKPSDGFVLR